MLGFGFRLFALVGEVNAGLPDMLGQGKEMIRLLQAEGKTILLTSHNYDDIEQLCDVVYIIDGKRVVPVSEELISEYFNKR